LTQANECSNLLMLAVYGLVFAKKRKRAFLSPAGNGRQGASSETEDDPPVVDCCRNPDLIGTGLHSLLD
jgi:hypothetical protein